MSRGRPKLTQRQKLQNKLSRLEKEIEKIKLEILAILPEDEVNPLPVKEPETTETNQED